MKKIFSGLLIFIGVLILLLVLLVFGLNHTVYKSSSVSYKNYVDMPPLPQDWMIKKRDKKSTIYTTKTKTQQYLKFSFKASPRVNIDDLQAQIDVMQKAYQILCKSTKVNILSKNVDNIVFQIQAKSCHSLLKDQIVTGNVMKGSDGIYLLKYFTNPNEIDQNQRKDMESKIKESFLFELLSLENFIDKNAVLFEKPNFSIRLPKETKLIFDHRGPGPDHTCYLFYIYNKDVPGAVFHVHESKSRLKSSTKELMSKLMLSDKAKVVIENKIIVLKGQTFLYYQFSDQGNTTFYYFMPDSGFSLFFESDKIDKTLPFMEEIIGSIHIR